MKSGGIIIAKISESRLLLRNQSDLVSPNKRCLLILGDVYYEWWVGSTYLTLVLAGIALEKVFLNSNDYKSYLDIVICNMMP